jgi:hypothetical protein
MAGKHATTKRRCNYCTRPIKTTILANDKPYCGKLCAVLGLFKEAQVEDLILGDMLENWVDIMEGICDEDPKRSGGNSGIDVPIKVRFSDAADVEELHESAPKGINYVVVAIDDAGTPDWEPGPNTPTPARNSYWGAQSSEESKRKMLAALGT